MASRVVTQMVSDVSGEEIESGSGGETVQFAYRGTSYTIDLTEAEARDFDDAVAIYVQHATQQGRARRATASGSSGKGDAKAIRAWAQEEGIDVPARGRIPADVRAQYEASK